MKDLIINCTSKRKVCPNGLVIVTGPSSTLDIVFLVLSVVSLAQVTFRTFPGTPRDPEDEPCIGLWETLSASVRSTFLA